MPINVIHRGLVIRTVIPNHLVHIHEVENGLIDQLFHVAAHAFLEISRNSNEAIPQIVAWKFAQIGNFFQLRKKAWAAKNKVFLGLGFDGGNGCIVRPETVVEFVGDLPMICKNRQLISVSNLRLFHFLTVTGVRSNSQTANYGSGFRTWFNYILV